ncbi:exodeoxyribonuclease VII large subunit, partial [Enterococcus faecium]
MAQEYLTVTTLTKYLKRKFDADPYLERVYLTGEISNFRLRANAHQYFSLKDDHAKISAIMFKGAFQKLRFQPKEGMKVLVVGRISLYEAGGSYQIYVEHMEPDGIGALYQELEERKEKLMKEGLFQGPKKMLPRFPKRIAVLTSPSGAVIRDIITTVKRRYPIVQLVLFPTVVQGNQAADNVVRNIQRVEEMGNFDTMIIGRGGGSIEDLWPFNEERVARAIYQANTPVISSVGHETDTTIADLVADVRAATPTAAAELAVPVLSEELMRIQERQARLQQAFVR